MASSAGHLVHGMGTDLESPAWPAITAGEADAALARFPEVGRLTALRWHSPRPFSAAALVHTTQGEFVLKRHHRSVRGPEGLAEEHGFIGHLRKAGMPVPEVMPTGEGAGTVVMGAWSYELHRRAPGADLYRDRLSWTPFLSPDHAHAAGAALARLHAAARGYDVPGRKRQPLVASFTILPAPDPLGAAEAYVAARPALAGFLDGRNGRRQLERLFAALGNGLSARLAGQASLWTHNDWHPSNLLWAPDGAVRTAFDFGLADRTCAAHDLATAIERTAIEWLQLGRGADEAIADPSPAFLLLAGYQTVLPLSADDIETILRLLPLVHVEFALSEVEYFAGIMANREDAALAWDGYLVGHAEWFLSAAGQAFLRRVGEGAPA